MLAVIKETPAPGLALKEIPAPEPGQGQVLVKINYASICGTDSLIYNWAPWAAGRMKPPVIVGHEFAGEIVENGPGTSGMRPGTRVSAESHIFCGRCLQCRTGRPEICRELKIMGVDRDGSFAQYAAIPERNIWVNHPDIPDQIATLQEPLGNAVDTLFAEDVAGKRILITGAGPIGLMCAALARACGAARIIVSDPNEYRLSLAEGLGADIVLNPKVAPLKGPVLTATAGDGVDVLLEVSGSKSALVDSLPLVTPGGRVSLLGIFRGEAQIALTEAVIFKKLRIYGITGRRIFSTWQTLSRLLSSRRLDISKLITHELPLADFQKGFELMESGRCGKVLFRINGG